MPRGLVTTIRIVACELCGCDIPVKQIRPGRHLCRSCRWKDEWSRKVAKTQLGETDDNALDAVCVTQIEPLFLYARLT